MLVTVSPSRNFFPKNKILNISSGLRSYEILVPETFCMPMESTDAQHSYLHIIPQFNRG